MNTETSGARAAYETLAPGYDELTKANDYEMWLGEVLLPELEERGLRRGSAFDVGCGTGRAFEPLLERGWRVAGCDLSPAMLSEARRKFGDSVPLTVADARELPPLGPFELVLALNDVVNYLTGEGDLERALRGMRANLAPEGLLLFDSNSLGLFRSQFTPDAGDGGIFEATVATPGVEPHVHRQRHFPLPRLREAIEAAGLECLAILGQRELAGRVLLADPADEQRDEKLVCIARRPAAQATR
ncbi:MAG TPA: class I SAM-dependent methyltransferase [Solirubrobacterales bacterium]|nr:class I SAM-dependent methyltransferase [Solirubrobacterales bacterium]